MTTTTRAMTDRAGRPIVTSHERTVPGVSVTTYYLGDPDTRADGSRIVAQVTRNANGHATIAGEDGRTRLGIYSVPGAIGAARDLVTAERDRLVDTYGAARVTAALGVDMGA